MRQKILTLGFASIFILGFSACHRNAQGEGPMERSGKAVDKAGEQTGEAVKKGVNKTGEAVENTGEKMQK